MVQFSLKEIQQLISADLKGDPSKLIFGVASLEHADETQISVLSNQRYRPLLKKTNAGAIIVGEEEEQEPGKNYLVVANPTTAFQIVIEAFFKKKPLSKFAGIHPTAFIDPEARLGKDVTVGAFAVIEARAVIGDRSNICAHAYVGTDVTIGSDCTVYQRAVIREDCILGDRVILQPGCVIGSCGYGYYSDKMGKHHKLNQIGIVQICDDVEIGANATIDRARFDKTLIREGTKIDNLVQIGHNVEIGKDCLIVAQVGIAGSTQLGNHVVLGGKVGIAGHVKLDDGVMVGAYSAVSKSLEKGKYLGVPAEPAHQYLRTMGMIKQLSKASKQLKKALKFLGADDSSSES